MLGVAFSPPAPVRADVTVSQTGKVTGGVAEEYTKKLRVKGLKLRVDSLYGKESRTVIFFAVRLGDQSLLHFGEDDADFVGLVTQGHNIKDSVAIQITHCHLRDVGRKRKGKDPWLRRR